jgi:hypothetical protein
MRIKRKTWRRVGYLSLIGMLVLAGCANDRGPTYYADGSYRPGRKGLCDSVADGTDAKSDGRADGVGVIVVAAVSLAISGVCVATR